MKYSVEIVYQKHYPTVQFLVEAENVTQAQQKARQQGIEMGFNGAVKKFVIQILN